MQGSGLAEAVEQLGGDQANAKRSGVGLKDECQALFRKNQGIDTGIVEVIEQMVQILRSGPHSDRRAQGAIAADDGGGEMMGVRPQATDNHGRNSSRAVCTCAALTRWTLANAAAERA